MLFSTVIGRVSRGEDKKVWGTGTIWGDAVQEKRGSANDVARQGLARGVFQKLRARTSGVYCSGQCAAQSRGLCQGWIADSVDGI